MPEERSDIKELGYYYALAQVGLEMVAPAGLGLILDYYLGWRPWGVIGGAVLGLVGGIGHLIAMANRQDQTDVKTRRDGQ